MEEIDFDAMEIWTQIYGLSLYMYNSANAHRIIYLVGNLKKVKSDHTLQQQSFLRVKIKIDTNAPLMDGFWWTNSKGEEK